MSSSLVLKSKRPLRRRSSSQAASLIAASYGAVLALIAGNAAGALDEPEAAKTSSERFPELAVPGLATSCQAHAAEHESAQDSMLRELAFERVAWQSSESTAETPRLKVKLLGFNDFHGQLGAGRSVASRPVGGAAVLASYLRRAAQGPQDATFLVHGGDHVGASPPASALLHDEPAIAFLNLLANEHCGYFQRLNPRCNLVGTLGNHELDEGLGEALRLIYGGNHEKGPFLEARYRGAKFPYVSANVVRADSGLPILPPFVIKLVRGVPIAFIGAVLKETPTIVTPSGVVGLRFQDEAGAVNKYARLLKSVGVRAIVLQIHQGGSQANYTGATQPGQVPSGPILDIIQRLDDEIDVVVSGHTHQFTNALVTNGNGKTLLVTQAFSASTAYADIDLEIDVKSRDIVAKSASIVTTFADVAGFPADPAVSELVTKAEAAVAPLVNRVVGSAAFNITRLQAGSGESALGNLIADAQRAAVSADFAFVNPGGIRADLKAGTVTWGDLFTVQPFGNNVVRVTLTGQQVQQLLEQQWVGQTSPRLLQISGLSYTWDNARPAGSRVVEVRKDGAVLDKLARYTVAVNSFIASGGDNFTVLTEGLEPTYGLLDLDALVAYVTSRPQPITSQIEYRILRLN